MVFSARHNKTPRLSRSTRVFLFLFFCLALISCSGVFILGKQMIARRHADYDIRMDLETERLNNYFGQSFESNLLSCNTVFSSKWYSHYRNVSGIYQDEFDALKRIEISQTLQSMLTGMPFVSDILIITPALDSVICRSGWYTLENYQMVYPFVQIDASTGDTVAPEICVLNDSLCAVVLNDSSVRRDKTILCMLIDKKTFISCLKSICPQQAVYIEATLCGQLLGTLGEKTPALRTAAYSPASFSLSVGYRPFEEVELPGILALLAALLFALLLACVLISMFAMYVINRPVARMVLRAGGQKHDMENPFRFLQNYFNDLSSQSDQLSAEKESLIRSKDRFLSMMNDEIYYGMLTNPGFHFDDDYVVSVIPELQEKKPCLLALFVPKYPYRVTPPRTRTHGRLFPHCHAHALHPDQSGMLPIPFC